MGSTQFRIPPALSSVLAALEMLQLRADGILNCIGPLVSVSNYYVFRYYVDVGTLPLYYWYLEVQAQSLSVQDVRACEEKVRVYFATTQSFAESCWKQLLAEERE